MTSGQELLWEVEMAEHFVVVKTYKAEEGFEEMTSDELRDNILRILNKLIAEVKEELKKTDLKPGSEIISHEITRIENRLVVSFIVREP